ncbi:hypothetical protein [Serratia fonticola]|uniref:hypothetical protein n=1 Tax=Serratia fonticola TaxID=47917 RepID=UPI0021AD6147|nr:hypothetical protein [Serratia fonticola]MDK2377124.1 hypothetical protein [Serratia fonticola]
MTSRLLSDDRYRASNTGGPAIANSLNADFFTAAGTMTVNEARDYVAHLLLTTEVVIDYS